MFSFWKLKKEKSKINRNIQVDEKGRALFNICIKDKNEVISPFYYDEKEVVNVEFANLLDNIVRTVPIKQGVHLSLNCDGLENEEKERYSKAIKNYYENKMLDTEIRLKENSNLVFVTILLSIISLTGLFLVNLLPTPWVLIEVVDIIAWVFVWEAVDMVAFQRTLIRYEHNRAKSLYQCKISY